MKHTVFICAVTAEFGGLRDQIASVLPAKGHMVKVQSDFRQDGFADITLSKLEGYVARCERSGLTMKATRAPARAAVRPDVKSQKSCGPLVR